MKKLTALLALSLVTVPALAQKPCEELKAEIAAKLEARGVKNYQLEIVPADQASDKAKVVGTCERGSKKIT